MPEDWEDNLDSFGDLSILEAIMIASKGGPSMLFDVPKGPVLDAWLRGAHVTCTACGLEVEPQTDAWGQILDAASWCHIGMEDLAPDEPLPCKYFRMRLLSNLQNGELAGDVKVEE